MISFSLSRFIYFNIKYAKKIPRMISTLKDNLSVYIKQTSPKRGPFTAVWVINNRCNAKCIFCDYWKINKETNESPDELSLNEKLNILNQLKEAGVVFVSLCGGEPLLSEDLPCLIKEAKEKGMIVNVSTNGSLLEENVEKLIDAGLDFITVSIDSHDPLVYDTFRGYRGLFRQMERGIEKLRTIRRHKRPYIVSRCLINRKNGFALKEFIKYWNNKVDDILFKPIYENSHVYFKVPSQMRFLPEDRDRFKDYYNHMLKEYKILNNPYHKNLPTYFFDADRLKGRFICFAGTYFTNIDRKGNLYPCIEQGNSMGNLLKRDFLDIWRSEQMKDFRKELKNKGKCAGCWADHFIQNVYLQKLIGGGRLSR